MNDRYDGHAEDQYQIVDYDAYGQPVYRQVPPRQAPQHGPHGAGTQQGARQGAAPAYGSQQQPYGYDDPYATTQQPAMPPQAPYGTDRQPGTPPLDPPDPPDPFGSGYQPAFGPHDGYGTGPHGAGQHGTGHYPIAPPQDGYGTGQHPAIPPRDDPYGTGQRPVIPPQDPYGTGRQPVVPPRQTPPRQDPYGTGPQRVMPPYESPQGTGQHPVVPPPAQDPYQTARQPVAPPQGPYDPYDPYGPPGGPAGRAPRQRLAQPPEPPREQPPRLDLDHRRYSEQGHFGHGQGAGGGDGPASGADEYQPEEFSFVAEEDEESQDVIDWLKFTESRTERREEARRRARNRVVAVVVVLALALVGGVGYLWQAGKLPGLSDTGGKESAQAGGPQNRDVIVVHLHNTRQGGTSTALLVDNTTTKHGTTVLLPNSLALTNDDGTPTTMGKSVDDDGSTGTRESIDTLLGTPIEGTWRLDTPYLDNLVELVGNIDVTTNANVPDPAAKKDGKGKAAGAEPLVKKGENQTLSGPMAVAYATYRAPGEQESAQLSRFGQVMQGVLRKMSSDPQSATVTVQTLAQILDPSLTDKDLGAFLAKLADHAKSGEYSTMVLPVQRDGSVTEKATDSVVENVLGGAVKAPGKDAPARVGVKNANGSKEATEAARVTLVNGGYTFIDGGQPTTTQTSSQVTYSDTARKKDATEVAKTLGLPASAVKKGTVPANADVSVVLGQDYDYQQDASTS